MIRRFVVASIKRATRKLYWIVRAEIVQIKKETSQQQVGQYQSYGAHCHISQSAEIIHPKSLVLGRNVHIGDDCHIFAQGGVIIKDNAHISRRVAIYGSDHEFREVDALPFGPVRRWRQVVIERNVWIGMNACILPGVRIGEGAIIGMGAIIASDVPSRAIVGQSPFRLLGERDEADYARALSKAKFGARDGELADQDMFFRTGYEHEPKLVFVVTTGRSGSTTLAEMFTNHPRISARHEPRPQLIKWSTDFAAGRLSIDGLRSRLRELYLDASVFDTRLIHIESDQKYFNMISVLAELLPSAKFVWLTRSGIDVVSSTYGRGWYDDSEGASSRKLPWYYNEYRITAVDVGQMSEAEWDELSVFAKNCWYWSHVNSEILHQVGRLKGERWIRISLENLTKQKRELETFLGTDLSETRPKRTNQAWHPVHILAKWTDAQKFEFRSWCGTMMDKLYPDDTRDQI